MSIGTKIDSNKGVEQVNGSGGLQITPNGNDRGFSPSALVAPLDTSATSQNGSFTVSTPGYVLVSGSLATTGTLPPASTWPGAFVMLGRDLNASGPFLLTGSARSTGVLGVFSINTAISGTNTGAAIGDSLTVDDGQGGLCLWSDGRLWIPMAASGSFSIA